MFHVSFASFFLSPSPLPHSAVTRRCEGHNWDEAGAHIFPLLKFPLVSSGQPSSTYSPFREPWPRLERGPGRDVHSVEAQGGLCGLGDEVWAGDPQKGICWGGPPTSTYGRQPTKYRGPRVRWYPPPYHLPGPEWPNWARDTHRGGHVGANSRGESNDSTCAFPRVGVPPAALKHPFRDM